MKKILGVLFSIAVFLFIGTGSVSAADSSSLEIRLDYNDEFIYQTRRLPEITIYDENGDVVKSFRDYEKNDDPRGEMISKNGFNVLFNDLDVTISIDNLKPNWTYDVSLKYMEDTLNLTTTKGELNGALVAGDNEIGIYCDPITTDLVAKFDSSGDYDADYAYHVTAAYYFHSSSQKIFPKSGKIKYHGAQEGEITLDLENPSDVQKFFVANLALKHDDVIVFEDTTFFNSVGEGYAFFRDVACTYQSARFLDCSDVDPEVSEKIVQRYNVVGNSPSGELGNGYWNFAIYPKPFTYTLTKVAGGYDIQNKPFKLKVKAYVPSTRADINYPVVGDHSYSIKYGGEEVGTGVASFDENGIAYIDIYAYQTLVFYPHYEAQYTESWGRVWYKYDDDNFSSGTIFEVEELDNDDYTLINNEFDFSRQGASTLLANVRRHDGTLSLTKEIVGDIPEDSEFKFKIKLSEDYRVDYPTRVFRYTIGEEEGAIYFEDDGTTEVTLKGGETITIYGLPNGINYEVTEEDTEYTVRSENASGVVEDDTQVLFVNEKEKVEEKKQEVVKQENPKTLDNISQFIIVGLISMIGIGELFLKNKKCI